VVKFRKKNWNYKNQDVCTTLNPIDDCDTFMDDTPDLKLMSGKKTNDTSE
jgi:hypothetical protein